MRQLEPSKPAEHFDKFIAFSTELIQEREEKLEKDPTQFVKIHNVYGTIFSKSYQSFVARYTRGDAMQDLAAKFPSLIRKWEQYLQHSAHEPFVFDAPITNDVRYVSNYTLALWMLSWAYVFGLDEGLWLRLVACIGNAGKDLLVERLILQRLPWLAAERPVATRLVYPKAYQPLYDALDAPSAAQSALLTTFLQGWYKHMKKAYWYNAHKEGGFFGYWAWEAAGVTVAFNLDDTRYRDLPYYPKDAVAYTRTR